MYWLTVNNSVIAVGGERIERSKAGSVRMSENPTQMPKIILFVLFKLFNLHLTFRE